MKPFHGFAWRWVLPWNFKLRNTQKSPLNFVESSPGPNGLSRSRSAQWTDLCFAICRIFSGKVYHPEPPHAQSFFLFPIVFCINLIHFFDGKNNIGLSRFWSFVLGSWSLVARLAPFERVGTVKEGGIFWQRKVWTHCEFQRHNGDHLRRERRKVWKRN